MPYVVPEEANNRLIDYVEEIKARNGSPPWRERALATERFRMLVHCWPPGFGHPKHYHPRADEIWYIYEGQLKVIFDDGPEIVAGPGSVLFAKKGTAHDMVAVGKDPLVMLVFVTPNEPDDEVSLTSQKVKFPE
ncbi:MAG: cupin domain-containing protein [Candidatus Bathyarchaeia archaeon]